MLRYIFIKEPIEMKNYTLNLILLVLITFSCHAQDTSLLDEKAGYKDFKIGQSITSWEGKTTKSLREKTEYIMKDAKPYEVDNQKIDKVILKVSKDDFDTIESISLMFEEGISSRSPRYNFYHKLVSDAFGEPSEKSSGVSHWNGEKVKLTSASVAGIGFLMFKKIYSEEENKRKSLKALDKF